MSRCRAGSWHNLMIRSSGDTLQNSPFFTSTLALALRQEAAIIFPLLFSPPPAFVRRLSGNDIPPADVEEMQEYASTNVELRAVAEVRYIGGYEHGEKKRFRSLALVVRQARIVHSSLYAYNSRTEGGPLFVLFPRYTTELIILQDFS